MKILKYISVFLLLITAVACDNNEFGDTDFIKFDVAPTDVTATFQVTQDNTGVVTIAPTASGAVSFNVYFGDETKDPVALELGGSVKHTYAEGEYQVKVIAKSLGGKTTEVVVPLTVAFKAPENLVVAITNDNAVSKKITVKATADFAINYDVDYGDGSDIATANIGDELTHIYAKAGKYTVKVTAKGVAKATTSKSQEIEATVLQQPTVVAPTQPNRDANDVISLFCSKYADLEATNFNPDWGQSGQGSGFAEFDLSGDKMLQYTNVSYQGVQLAKEVDLSKMEFLHMDIWTADMSKIQTSLISKTNGEKPVVSELTADGWTSIDIPLTEFTKQGLTVADIHQLKFVSANWLKETKAGGTVFIDNLYFYKKSSSSSFDDGLLTNGDFENGATPWTVGVGDTPVNVVTKDGNTYYSVDVTTAGNPYDVNMSQKVAITEGKKYTLSFEAWSDRDRTIIAGIGLSSAPWTNVVETVNITSTKKVYTLSLVATGFGADNARVIFDLGAAVGVVNIDNVSLVLDDGGSSGTTTPFTGIWKLANQAGALMVGNEGMGSNNWWAIDDAGVTQRACYFDDTYVFNADGTFKNVQGESTWIEAWQGVSADGCGVPVAPHNGSNVATYSYNATAKTLTLKGKGAYIGLAKAYNGGELKSPADAPESITYDVKIESANTIIVGVSVGAGYWTYKLVKAGTETDTGSGDTDTDGTQIDLPVTFDVATVDYTLTDFGGNSSSIVADPDDENNKVAKVIKTASAETWAGTTIGKNTGFATNIPISLSKSKLSVRVWSPKAGVPIRLKIEDANDNTHTCETESQTTVANGWETLVFDFANQATGTETLSVGLDKGWVYNKASIFFNFGTDGASAGEQTYYFDDVKFVE